DESNPLLERLNFLCIVSSNMDEFFEIRVAGLKEQIKYKSIVTGPEKMSPRQVFEQVSREAHVLVERQYKLLNEVILPAMARQDIRFLRRTHWNPEQSEWIRDFFFREVMPVLTPIGLDPAHPFPRVVNKSLNFAVELEGKDAFGRSSGAAIVQAPRVLPRVIQLPREIAGHEYGFVFLSSVLHTHVGELFTGMHVKGCYQFRVTRNSNLFVDEEEVTNLRQALQGELSHRHFGNAVRLEVADNCSPEMAEFLLLHFDLGPDDLYQVNGLVNLVRLIQIPDRVDRPDLKYPPFIPGLPICMDEKQPDMFQAIRNGDVLLHQPFQSFNPVVDFLQQAADDPNVLAVKQTVYRTGSESVLMEALMNSAKKGKEVT
ncbi:MAG: polyphosphate kinase, partial [Sulfurimicrobium sp.]|nr:polyphosphate kinase [Sulfurimicrobium sp.]